MTPSNITAKEFAKYYIYNADRKEIQDRFEVLLDELEELKKKEAQFDRIEEVLREQIGFARELLTDIKEEAEHNLNLCSRKESKLALISKTILTKIENSYFEL